MVVFPFDPVTAIMKASVYLLANSISEMNLFLIIFGCNFFNSSNEIPGLIITSLDTLNL